MPKRLSRADSEDEDFNPSSSKRAREDRGAVDIDDEPVASSSKRKSKGKGKKADAEDSDTDMEDGEAGEFEEEHGEQIREAVRAKQKIKGGVAEHGIIETVEMHNFMCHKYLTFNFGPQINFIIGHNGSGKSAVLSAITVALGGKSNSTGRGNGLKSFIKEGESISEVTLSLKNQGEEAYKPEVFGKSIRITRRFTKDGSATWKICSATGALVSNKKEELSAICDHMNIQVDNPMNVLTQDSARQFLSASGGAEKYRLFLKGTQLQQLSDEYDACLQNITQTARVLEQKEQLLPELREKYDEAKVRYDEANKAVEQKRKVETLNKELAWAHVAAKEKDLSEKVTEITKREKRLDKIQASIDKSEEDLAVATAGVQQFENEAEALGTMDHHNDEKQRINSALREAKNSLSSCREEQRTMNSSLKTCNGLIKDYESQIENETRRASASNSAKREEDKRQLENLQTSYTDTEQRAKSLGHEHGEKVNQVRELEQEGKNMERERKTLQDRILNLQGNIDQCRARQNDSLAAYGKNVAGVRAKIESIRWHGRPPLGPLGMHVTLREQNYANVIRSQLAHNLLSYAITDARDRPQLKQVLDQSGNHGTSITIFQPDLFDYSSGEPPEGYLTVLRALNFDNEYVKRILINQTSIERTVLGLSRKELDGQLKSLGGGLGWSADMMRVMVYPEGGGSSTGLSELNPRSPANGMFRGANIPEQISNLENQIRAVQDNLRSSDAAFKEKRMAYNEAQQTVDRLKREEQHAWTSFRSIKAQRDRLQEEVNNDLPVEVATLEIAKQEQEAEKVAILAQFETLTQKIQAINDRIKPLMDELDVVKAKISDFEVEKGSVVKKTQQAAEARFKAQTQKDHYQNKYNSEKAELAQLQDACDTTQQEFTNWTNAAQDFAPVRWDNPRTVDVIERQLRSTKDALAAREKRQGASVEEITAELIKRQQELETVENDLSAMKALNSELKESLFSRITRWNDFRRHIALRCKIIFGYNLSHRGYYGKVIFDHDAQTLTLKVQTDDMVGTQSRHKDPSSLSGGEKSFSTICLLLSLWESIGCPLRCLDEFDVFMDAINRRTSMKMMIDTASASDKKQYILITPQDMSGVQFGPQVRVHRMSDPERGQATLSFT